MCVENAIRPLLRLVLALLLTGFASPVSAQMVVIPDPALNAAVRAALQKPTGPLTQQDLLSLTSLKAGARGIVSVAGLEVARNLTSLDLDDNQIASFSLLSNLTNLTSLDLSFNAFTNFSLPSVLNHLGTLNLRGNQLTSFSVPAGLTSLTNLDVSENQLTSFILPAGSTNLTSLNLSFNQLAALSLPSDLGNLVELNVGTNRLASLTLLAALPHLTGLHLRSNQFTSFHLQAGLTALTLLDLGENHLSDITLPTDLGRLATLRITGNLELTSLILPMGLSNLTSLAVRGNGLTHLALPPGMSHLVTIDASANQLTRLQLPPGLTSLTSLFLAANQLSSLTFPPDLTQLTSLVLGQPDNPLTTVVLSETLAANLVNTVTTLRNQGVAVFTFPFAPQLVSPQKTANGDFSFDLIGPPGLYTILASADLRAFSVLGTLNNKTGTARFTDVGALSFPQMFYRATMQGPPPNMVLIQPNTFKMGSPNTEQDRNANEGPLTTVTLTHAFWIGQYEVTQQEYLSVTGTNPSVFPGDLSRPVSSVSWFDATNYCVMRTQQELAAGRIPAGSLYRLPTEAEWECAARAGTSTRFSYGDDPSYASLPDHAWFSQNGGATVHPVGLKLPNAWGLYDMAGNVWEWCQDWFGPLPGGVQTDPTGPASSPSALKVMRGGAFDFGSSDCRSARRNFFGASPFLTDSDLGFRVVLILSP